MGFESWEALEGWRGSNITLRVDAEYLSKFQKEAERWEENKDKVVTKSSGIFGSSERTSATKITEYFWDVTCQYSIYFFRGNDLHDKLMVAQGSTSEVIVTMAKEQRPPVTIQEDFNFKGILDYLKVTAKQPETIFKIDRTAKKCKTPRRNPQVEGLITQLQGLYLWSAIFLKLANQLHTDTAHKDASLASDSAIFEPILPMFNDDGSNLLLLPAEVLALRNEQKNSLCEKLNSIEKLSPTGLLTNGEIKIAMLSSHLQQIATLTGDGLDFIESMLSNQLVAAVGKHLSDQDMIEYMEYHNRLLFNKEYAPCSFNYDVRRHGYSPEGSISIESSSGCAINSIVRKETATSANRLMKFNINGSTEVCFSGTHYIHGYVSHRFSNSGLQNLTLNVRARQFSAFVFMAGTIVASDKFQPNCAMIVQNKDELAIPLMLETMPTPKEFRDAIVSLSPEQQRFAKAFRAMQLQSTLFALCVIPIKPQLENLLKIPSGSLTKEIRLTQDIMKVMLEYQIPSDLVTYDGDGKATQADKIAGVRKHASAVLSMIDEAKDQILKEQEDRAKSNLLRQCEEEEECEIDMAVVRTKKNKMKSAGFGGAMRGGPPRMLMAQRCAAPPPAAVATGGFSSNEVQAQGNQLFGSSVAPPVPAAVPSIPPPAIEIPEDIDEDTEDIVDYTKMPVLMDHNFEQFDPDSSLRPTKIVLGGPVTKKSSSSILSPVTNELLSSEELKMEKSKAMDLIDALSRSGELIMGECDLHVVIAATHQFDKSLMQTVIEDNVNPIEKLENSTLIVASTISDVPVASMLSGKHLPRIRNSFPAMFIQ